MESIEDIIDSIDIKLFTRQLVTLADVTHKIKNPEIKEQLEGLQNLLETIAVYLDNK
jgi:hypothetical protein